MLDNDRGVIMISVVIPTLNAEATLASCLASVHAQDTPVDRIVVVDAGSTDQTVPIAQRHADLVLTAQANRSLQRNIGWQATDSPVVLFVDADMVLDPMVISECQRVFENESEVVGLVIPERSFGSTFWARVKAYERSFYQGVWWMEAARCFRRGNLEAVGGYAPSLIGGEDWDLDERIRQQGIVRRIGHAIWHNEQALSLANIRQKKGHYRTTLQAYADRHPKRAKSQFSLLARLFLFLRRPLWVVGHPILFLAMGILGWVEWRAKTSPSSPNGLEVEKPIERS